ncbi:calcium/sodium antiporter [Ruegeria aquimaris]|uniref:Calcium/sodium antiporter n=1 Tax=Ruegeria aquimaris TaxID=2984333 RepID=A0ABT3AKG7_9RHOB|nr:calcium/sodium antiporter [Ruegeria sp. XHP0148]MCV2889185.1 calcium/sodium antiporter [Ruegeria sp. XHP0148]
MILLSFAAGLTALILGGDFLVRGATSTAIALRIPPLVIGMIVVGFGTSLPELLVSVNAALAHAPDIALGNVIGSNTANILLILGLAAVLFPIVSSFIEVRKDLILVILATLALAALLADGRLSRLDGILMLTGLALFLWSSIRQVDADPQDNLMIERRFRPLAVLQIAGGLVALVFGARLLVDSATELARMAHISEAVIGLTIVAIGTSLPELATSVIAAFRRNSAMSLGNVIGSNLFNILGILGVTAVIAPIQADTRFLTLDTPIALAAALLLTALLWFGGISRLAGVCMLAVYVGYLGWMGLS